jgi:hypothetical protein
LAKIRISLPENFRLYRSASVGAHSHDAQLQIIQHKRGVMGRTYRFVSKGDYGDCDFLNSGGRIEMALYPKRFIRCEHIKVNGVQCGSPALRNQAYCYFHAICHRKGKDALLYLDELEKAMLPTLEDANSVQLGLAGVMRQLLDRHIDHKTAGLMLYALQTASANLKRTTFEPDPMMVVIDRETVKRRPIGATAWSVTDGCEYDEAVATPAAEGRTNDRTNGRTNDRTNDKANVRMNVRRNNRTSAGDSKILLNKILTRLYEMQRRLPPGLPDESTGNELDRRETVVEN